MMIENNIRKPLLEDMMKSLYYLKEKQHISKGEFHKFLSSEYGVYSIEEKDNKLICYQEIDGKSIRTSIII